MAPNVPLEIDATFVPDVAPCQSGRWTYQGVNFVQPEQRTGTVSISARGSLPAGELVTADRGEFGGALSWTVAGQPPVALYPVNSEGLVPWNDGALVLFGELGPYQGYRADTRPLPAGAESVWMSNGPSGYGYVLSASRDAKGQWQLSEIARLPRAADTIAAIATGLFAAWTGGRVVVFSPRGIQGLAACTG